MIRSEFRKILIQEIEQYGRSVLGRPLKPFEVVHFLNLYEEKLNTFVEKALMDIRTFILTYMEEKKYENTDV